MNREWFYTEPRTVPMQRAQWTQTEKSQSHLLVSFCDYRSNPSMLKATSLSFVLFLRQLKAWEMSSIFLKASVLFLPSARSPLFSLAFFFDQTESPCLLMWSSLQQTWWLETQGVTMLVSMSAEPTSPGPESLSLLLLSCKYPVGVVLCSLYKD